MFADWAGARSTGPFDPGTTFAAYHGAMPDYVLGTDWKKSMAWPAERAALSPPREVAEEDDTPSEEPAPTLTRTAYEEPSPAPHDYPSMGGAHPSVIDVPPPAPAEEAQNAPGVQR
jgi:hypothetical protein